MSEKSGSWVLKGLAVLSAVGLASGYVIWKGAEAKKLERREAEKAKLPEETERAEAWESLESPEAMLISGSKSLGGTALTRDEVGTIIDERTLMESPQGQAAGDALLPGSKSARAIIEFPIQEVGKEGAVRVLPGSKSFRVEFDRPEAQDAGKKP